MRWLALLLLCALPAQADEREILRGDAFDAVGRLNKGDGSFCTATLIAPDRILTAAHCLTYKRTQRRASPSRIHFVAGWRGGDYAAHRTGAEILLPDASVTDEIERDIAVIILETPISNIVPIPLAAFNNGPVVLVSYHRNRAHLPSIERDCRIVSQNPALLATDCRTDGGASGAPLIELTPEGPRAIASIVGYRNKAPRVTISVRATRAPTSPPR